jgi:uncharacterized protein
MEICSDNNLSELDDLLIQAYRNALSTSTHPDDLKREQRSWLSTVRNKCKDITCLKQVYGNWISELNSVTSSSDSDSKSSLEGIKIAGDYKKYQGQNESVSMEFSYFGECPGSGCKSIVLAQGIIEKIQAKS